ncbi:Protein of unknown function (DUF4005) [Castilleja foliolosa]|uniref:DUF4005 domain-containing protein n=1 Tax=Castilleja foliolosa TaxID=1961234 RepID=A0ABD3EBR6_9LAMI
MGKATKWFRSLLSSKKSPESSPAKKSSKWSLASSGDNSGKLRNHVGDPMASPYGEGIDANKHAIAVAAATAAVAEAALAAAQAAAEVVRLTSGGGRSGRGSGDRPTVVAAVKIQSAFRAYLARRALKALKGLVKLQALVRGHIVRKQSADMLRRMQAMARIQARASAHRSYPPDSPYAKINFPNSHHPGFANPRKYEERPSSGIISRSLYKPNHSRSSTGLGANKESSQIASRWLNHWMEQCAWEKLRDDERTAKILEIDTWSPHPNNKIRNDKTTPTSHYFSAWNETSPASRQPSNLQRPNPSISSEDDQVPAGTTNNSPRVHSGSSRPATTGHSNPRGPSSIFAPARSDCSRSLFGDYIGHPSYMANTESSRSKIRSHSAPKQRIEEVGLGGPYGGGDFWDYGDTASERGSFLAGRAGNYRYSGQVKRQGTPARDPGVGYSSIYGRRV